MKNKIIEGYINKLTKEDINQFAIKNGVSLSGVDIDYIYEEIKKNWQQLIYAEPTFVVNKIKGNISDVNSDKVIVLYKEYYRKYRDYL